MKPGILQYVFLFMFLASCSAPLIEFDPENITDTSDITITCNAETGNKGLKDFKGNVYVHLGLITDSSSHHNEWRYVKFNWGSTEEAAEAKREGDNSWSYQIKNLRQFFGVPANEKIFRMGILFRQGNCIDTNCLVLRNADKSDIYIPISEEP